jgi:hypothetical protein
MASERTFPMYRRGPRRGSIALLVFLGLAATLVAGAGARQEAGCVPNETDGSCLSTAPDSALVDLETPTFSEPTTITNPLFPISQLHSVVMLGRVDRLPFRTEVTLLPETKTIVWNSQSVEVLVSQYAAFLDGRLHEVAIDWYAQADDGSVWYFGEDVFNFEEGVVADTEGTWLAGKEGPAGMIMPADPQVGDVYRPENIPGLVFEEVTVKAIGQTVHGPHGPVDGAIVVEELHQDGTIEEKIFAPGYGEFLTGSGGELEALALAVPTDALPGLPSAELDALSTGAAEIFAAALAEDWDAAASSLDALRSASDVCQARHVPPMIEAQLSQALVYLVAAADARQAEEALQAALDVERASLDLQLRHRPPVEIDLARLDLQARQLLVDAAADDPGAVTGDVATLEWIWDRVAHALAPSRAELIATELGNLRAAADSDDLSVAAESAAHLHDLFVADQQAR